MDLENKNTVQDNPLQLFGKWGISGTSKDLSSPSVGLDSCFQSKEKIESPRKIVITINIISRQIAVASKIIRFH